MSNFNYFSSLTFGKKKEMSKKAKGRVLDYGGGIGALSIMLAQAGIKDITYLDVPGKTFEFAKWRFKRRGLDITAIEGSELKDKLSGLYDTIFCLDVIKHLLNPLLHTKRLADHLTSGGKLFITAA